ncbi:MAG: MCP four helix bundle domain-containing protein, partial [Armatimonadetes bacterium]|nr:MCP four helix bundle domain-containing protein [Armatimonadota bacterium]
MPNIKTEFILSGHKKQNPFLKRGRIITLNLRTKLIGSFVIILILMVGVGLMGTYTSKTIRDRLDNIIEKDVKPANILGDVARRV